MELKQRHGCVTAWLIFMIVLSFLLGIYYFMARGFIRQHSFAEIPNATLTLLGYLSIFNIMVPMLLFKWKKLGFWTYIVLTVAVFGVNLSINPESVFPWIGLLGILLLWAILQIKRNDISAWKNLE